MFDLSPVPSKASKRKSYFKDIVSAGAIPYSKAPERTV